MTPSEMVLISIVVFKERSEELTSRLLNLGIFHPADIRTIEEELKGLTPLDVEKEYAEWEKLETQLHQVSKTLNLSMVPSWKDGYFSPDKIKGFLNKIEEEVNPLVNSKEEIQKNLEKAEVMCSRIKDYALFPIKKSSDYTFLNLKVGSIEETNLLVLENTLKDIPHLTLPLKKQNGRLVVLIMCPKKDEVYLNKVLKEIFWQPMEYPEELPEISHEMQNKLNTELEEYRCKIAQVDKEINKLGEQYQEEFFAILGYIIQKKALLSAKKYAFITGRTFLISGWIPKEETNQAVKEVRSVAPSAYIEVRAAQTLNVDKEQIPVHLKHSRILKPFESLITSYGLPRYGTVDPTFFVAISFLIMFGAMFGDLGHGLVLVLSGFLLKRSRQETMKQAGSLLGWCGASSCFFGCLYGSFFGLEKIIPSLWASPFYHINDIFRVSVTFGIGILTLGILLNITNALLDKDYFRAFFDKAGLISGFLYWIGVALVSKSFIAQAPVPPAYLVILIAGVCLLFCKPVLERAITKKNESLGVAFMESAIDILEIVMGYLANTISFIRIAAFALAHAGLCMAIFELSHLLSGVGGNALSFLVILFGNILVILLEGMVVGIQSLRLNYYEFFSKFFVPGKQEFKPLTKKPFNKQQFVK